MASHEPRRRYARAILDILAQGPATANDITRQVWTMFPAAACIRAYRNDIDRLRKRDGSTKTGYDPEIDEQTYRGARRLVRNSLDIYVKNGTIAKEGKTFRLL